MIPIRITLDEARSSQFIEEVRSGQRNVVCVGHENSRSIYMYADIVPNQTTNYYLIAGMINDVIFHANADGYTTDLHNETGMPITILPQHSFSWMEAPGFPSQRDNWSDSTFIGQCIRSALYINHAQFHAPKITFFFEGTYFNIVEAVEMLYHHATSPWTRQHLNDVEISYLRRVDWFNNEMD